MNRFAITASLLALAAGGFAFKEWRERQRSEAASELVATERTRLATEVSNLKQRLDAANQRLVQSELQSASLKDDFGQIFSKTAPATGGGALVSGQPGFFVGGSRRTGAPSLRLTTPVKALDTIYHALYRKLKLSPEQIGHFKSAMIAAATGFEDLDRQARQKRVSPTDHTLQPRYAAIDAELRSKMSTLFGDAAVPVIEKFTETLSIRDAITQVMAELFYTAHPLTETQADQLVDVMQKHLRDPAGRLNHTFADARAMKAEGAAILSPAQIPVWNDFLEYMAKSSFGFLNRPRR
jgi:hypothetical protein